MSSTTNPPITVWSGQTVTTQPGMTDTVNIVGSATVTTNGNDTVNAGAGSDTIKVNAGNVVVNGNAGGTLTFIGGGSGTETLNLAGGTTTAETMGARPGTGEHRRHLDHHLWHRGRPHQPDQGRARRHRQRDLQLRRRHRPLPSQRLR